MNHHRVLEPITCSTFLLRPISYLALSESSSCLLVSPLSLSTFSIVVLFSIIKVTCNVWKPERTHHCSICNRCNLNMDHHCPWINNCVGFYNRKFFIQLLFYVYATLAVYIVTGSYPLYLHVSEVVMVDIRFLDAGDVLIVVAYIVAINM
mmetsp:Transcript_793/g.782  ORF Transcript_793/g.782 Transcript_793/m.782 type:complete len:150 (+) Transcript_793:141-590(+)